MPDEFDLDNPPPDDETSSSRRRRARRAEQSKSTDDRSSKGDAKTESALRGRLGEAFGKLGRQLQVKGDDELADAILEERDGMTQGLLSLTSSVTFLRGPLVLLVEVGLVILAFWRVGGILLRRLFAQRERFQAAQYDEQPDVPGAPEMPEGAVVQ